MNREICEKCMGGKIYWKLTCCCYPDRLLSVIIVDNNNEHKKYCMRHIAGHESTLCQQRQDGFEKFELINSECRYHLEHQLFDWNR